jgi:5-methylcytosine-specific restriction enzyme B
MSEVLRSLEGLQSASTKVIKENRSFGSYEEWLRDLSNWLDEVARVDRETFLSASFQLRLWNNEAIAATGQGHVDVSRVASDSRIAERLWDLRRSPLPEDAEACSQWFGAAWDEIERLVVTFTDRTPRLKLFRVFASLWPSHFTTVAHFRKLKMLARAMGLDSNVHNKVFLHQRVLARLDEAFANGGASLSLLERMTVPWLLFVEFAQETEKDLTEVVGEEPSQVKLNPLPADRRRRGMLAIAGFVPSVKAMLEFAREGCKRADFLEHIRSVNPRLASGSLSTNLNALIAEWGVLRAEGDDLHLTARGEAFLETGEPEEVSDWLLTKILGFDNLLFMLHEEPLPQKDVVAALQIVNPGWTSSFAPMVLINWAKSMELIETDASRRLHLTDRGKGWLSRIYWTPGTLTEIAEADSSHGGDMEGPRASNTNFELPPLADIIAAFPTNLLFPHTLVARLHAGLWSHSRRHFAVLTGLSGAGKTLLAMCYARGLGSKGPDDIGCHIVTVQPGWYDPSALLGYVNPIDSHTYMRTGFLDFVLEARSDQSRPYVVLLDEMNLSHPEQYLAPILSAMETGGHIELHSHADEISGVPSRVRYPENLVLIGTVNMDETTHGLSDKVLDRATVIEFWDIDVDQFPGWSTARLGVDELRLIRETLSSLVKVLRPLRLHFGWRTIGDVISYVEVASAGGVIDSRSALDHAVYSKILPKLRGEDTPRLRTCFDAVEGLLRASALDASAEKMNELSADLRSMGSARFWR